MSKGRLINAVRRFKNGSGAAYNDGLWRVAPSAIYDFVVYFNNKLVICCKGKSLKVVSNEGIDPVRAISVIKYVYFEEGK